MVASQTLSPTLFINGEQAQRNTEEAIARYKLQGEKYIAAALQHERASNMLLAEHCRKAAVEAYQKAEGAKIALTLQQQEYVKPINSQSLK